VAELSDAERGEMLNVCGTVRLLWRILKPLFPFTCVRNDNYWGFDERYPKNNCPILMKSEP
jgi:hypothetical protein